MAKIMIVEDELHIQKLLQTHLENKYDLIIVNDGQQALSYLNSHDIDLLISDVMMPKIDGFTLVKKIRNRNFNFPILMLTAKDTIRDKTVGFTNGADDYLTKPINYEELQLRIIALMRRANIQSSKRLLVGDVELNENTYQLSKENHIVELPKKEFELLFKLLSYPNQIFTQNQLLDSIWGRDSFSTEDTVKTHISRLRKKCAQFKDDFQIITVRGLGYKGEINEK